VITCLGVWGPSSKRDQPTNTTSGARQRNAAPKMSTKMATDPAITLAGVASLESGFGKNLRPSSAGAYGYGQFEPGTWASYGLSGVPLRTAITSSSCCPRRNGATPATSTRCLSGLLPEHDGGFLRRGLAA
jgi:hypothetical protein